MANIEEEKSWWDLQLMLAMNLSYYFKHIKCGQIGDIKLDKVKRIKFNSC